MPDLKKKKKSRIKSKNVHIVNRVETDYSEKQQQKTMTINVPSENSLWNSFSDTGESWCR